MSAVAGYQSRLASSPCSQYLGHYKSTECVSTSQLLDGYGVILGAGGCLSIGWRAQILREASCKNSASLRKRS